MVKIRLRRMGAKKAPYYRIVVADSLMGEVTPAMAAAVGQSQAVRILVPINRCETLIAGVSGVPASRLLEDTMDKIQGVLEGTL